MQTLVLDFTCRPVGYMTWQRAITQYYKSKVEIIDSYDAEVKSPSVTIKIPAVVRELKRYKRKNAVRFTREGVFLRDKGKCQYCGLKLKNKKTNGRDGFTFDHVIPRVTGGTTTWDNIVISCFDCNQKKKDRTPEQAGMKLLIKPHKPTQLPDVYKTAFTWRQGMPDQWKGWLVNIND